MAKSMSPTKNAYSYVALLRGINVGGHRIITMQDLKDYAAECGAKNIKTYIQSGNVLFDYSGAAIESFNQCLKQTIIERSGFEVLIMTLPIEKLRQAMTYNPYADHTPKDVHYYFTEADLTPSMIEPLKALATSGEQFTLVKKQLYLHTPNGMGRSKLAAKIDQALGVPTTARNARTIDKILTLSLKD